MALNPAAAAACAAVIGTALGGGNPTAAAAATTAWTPIIQALFDSIKANAVVLPTPAGMIAPAGGGAVTGTGTIS